MGSRVFNFFFTIQAYVCVYVFARVYIYIYIGLRHWNKMT
jgi:hypothetical protein